MSDAASAAMQAAREAMIAKRFGSDKGAATGGKGTVRRKHKAVSRASAADTDRKLGAALKKMGATVIPNIEEVNLFRDDGKVVHFVQPKVQASVQSNTYIISGNAETKALQELLPGIVSQMGQENLQMLQQQFAAAGMGGEGGEQAAAEDSDSDDDDVPELVEGDFETAAN